MKTITVEQVLSDEEVNARIGTFLEENDVPLVISSMDEPVEVLKPDGSVLLRYFPNVISAENLGVAYPVLSKHCTETNNRMVAGGMIPLQGKLTLKRIRKDGSESKTNIGRKVKSILMGYFDRYPRTPFCRQTAFTEHHAEEFKCIWPMLGEIDKAFEQGHPERYAIQKAMIEETSKDFFIPGTSFTTITVNKDFRTAIHFDNGDLREGFGVMAALRKGYWTGSYTGFPKYGCAVDMQNGGVCLADVHEAHGNTDRHTVPAKGHERVSLVCYYRERMINCGTAEEEVLRAQNRKLGDKLNDPR